MKWYPFATRWLKSSQHRESLQSILLDLTFLSDAGYRNTENKKKFFFGAVNDKEFELESIDREKKLAGFITGEVLGVEDEMYIRLHVGCFKHRRIYILLLLFTLCGMGLFIQGLMQNLPEQSKTYLFAMGGMLFLLLAYLFVISWQFSKQLQYTVDFFRGMYDAEVVEENDIPSVFLL
jgi:hypothetical protein